MSLELSSGATEVDDQNDENAEPNSSGAANTPRINSDYAILPPVLLPGFSGLQTRLQKKLGLDAIAEDLVAEAANANSYQEIGLIMVSIAARTEQHLREAELRSRYAMSAELKASLLLKARVFLLSHKLPAYRGRDIADVVYGALKKATEPDLPSDNDVNGKVLVLKEISTILSNFRYEIKKKIFDSLEPNHELANIATLSASIISPLKIGTTLTLYTRIAFLRGQAALYKKPSKTPKVEFWKFVDDNLSKVKAKFTTAIDQADFFSTEYEKDTKVLKPEASGIRSLEPNEVPLWIQKLTEAAADVTSSPLVARPSKRQRTSA
ncbi:hypothetical protein EV122DRAFT_275594 [Schizophyllum commune]